ncbi:hypothetical protein ACQRD6_11180 [Prevotella sp. SGI.027]|nr:hypothetical protein [Prevotellaceae bacterium]MDY3104296.1 hypothetical protein [Prevotella sp.]
MSKNLHVRVQKHTYWHSKALLLSSNTEEGDEKAKNVWHINLTINNLQKMLILTIFDTRACVAHLRTNPEEVIVKKILNLSEFLFCRSLAMKSLLLSKIFSIFANIKQYLEHNEQQKFCYAHTSQPHPSVSKHAPSHGHQHRRAHALHQYPCHQ